MVPGWPVVPVEPPPVEPWVVEGVPPDGLPDVPPLLPLEPDWLGEFDGLSLGGVGHPCGRGVPFEPGSVDEPVEPESPELPDDPPEEPCCDPDEPWLPPPDEPLDDEEPDELDGLDDPEPPPDDEGICELDPPLLPDEEGDEDGEEDDDPPDGEGMPLGIELDVVVLQPASVTATATASSVDKPGMRCMIGPSAYGGGEKSPALPTWMRRATSGSLSGLRARCRHPPPRRREPSCLRRRRGRRRTGTTAAARSSGRTPCGAPA